MDARKSFSPVLLWTLPPDRPRRVGDRVISRSHSWRAGRLGSAQRSGGL